MECDKTPLIHLPGLNQAAVYPTGPITISNSQIEIRRSANLLVLRNIAPRIWTLRICEKVGRVSLAFVQVLSLHFADDKMGLVTALSLKFW